MPGVTLHHDREGDAEEGEHDRAVGGHVGGEGRGAHRLVQVQHLSQVLLSVSDIRLIKQSSSRIFRSH